MLQDSDSNELLLQNILHTRNYSLFQTMLSSCRTHLCFILNKGLSYELQQSKCNRYKSLRMILKMHLKANNGEGITDSRLQIINQAFNTLPYA